MRDAIGGAFERRHRRHRRQRGASAWITGVDVDDCAAVGVDVAERARARLDRVTVRRTTGVGQAFAIKNGAVVEAVASGSIDSAVCGIAVYGASAKWDSGTITKSPVGACVAKPQMPLDCLRNATRYVDVGIPAQADRYDLPSSIYDAPASVCPTVEARATP